MTHNALNSSPSDRKGSSVADVQYPTDEIPDTQWEGLPKPTPVQTVSPWKEAVDHLTNGKGRYIPIPKDKTLKGTRIGLARQAARAHKMKLEFRVEGEGTNARLYARRSDKEYVPPPPKEVDPTKPKRQYTRRNPQDSSPVTP